ncbi:Nitrilase/cyanide hydratase and apolipoprotein N-acyltransferase [Thermovirga lienii DSM 17291]|uniref:Nitrilase/cyanide hydratase and apolipoprotein N-acyltransferase n=1 Tax=Thermovirga lienii (strain ATCC BAA-1197 / DSM 17291 / Cas60314) TaxID=580340 RepID=G7V7S4_THELD|nr:carbon-nitrogen hydrolase family protein [Thermovirga lienii]AER67328.1 Nitrilase/cyanide hydratase and apolipoprotein N-acyltransferase [Thermovirga lienii DSM 17291]
MKEFIVAGCQFTIKPMDVKANIEKALVFLEKAVKEHEADLVVFPETITTGFTPLPKATQEETIESLWEAVSDVPGPITEPIQEAAAKLGVHVVWPTYRRGPSKDIVYNSCMVIDDNGNIVGDIYDKTHPFPTERKEGGGWTTAGDKPVVVETKFAKIGLTICYDGDFPDLATTETLMGAEVIVRPSALLRTYDIWQFVNQARAYDNHVYYVAINSVGVDGSGNSFFGSSMIIDPTGWKLAQARGNDEIISAKLDPDPIKYVSHGTKSPMIFDHIEDRNVGVYKDWILKEGKCPFEPAKRIPYKKKSS